MAQQTTPRFSGVSHLDLTVSDAEASSAWYARALLLTRLRRVDLDNRVMIMLVNKEDGLIVGLNQHHHTIPDRFDEHRPGLDHVGLSVASRDTLDSWAAHLDEIGVPHSPVTEAPSGSGAALVFRDPDNIQLELWWTRPRA